MTLPGRATRIRVYCRITVAATAYMVILVISLRLTREMALGAGWPEWAAGVLQMAVAALQMMLWKSWDPWARWRDPPD